MPGRYDRFKFFKEHAGYSVPPGRAACALDLARAEETLEEAIELGLVRVKIEEDDYPIEAGYCDMTEQEIARKFDSNEWTGPYGVILELGGSEYSPSLWGIVVGPKGPGDPYMRVVAAELASEHADDLKQAIGDARDEANPQQRDHVWIGTA